MPSQCHHTQSLLPCCALPTHLHDEPRIGVTQPNVHSPQLPHFLLHTDHPPLKTPVCRSTPAQLMDEGQKLSKRQLELEGNVKKLRQQLKASEAEREKLSALLAAETSEAEGLRRAKAKAERDLVAAVEAGRQEVEAVRQQAQADMLSTQAEQVRGGRRGLGGGREGSSTRECHGGGRQHTQLVCGRHTNPPISSPSRSTEWFAPHRAGLTLQADAQASAAQAPLASPPWSSRRLSPTMQQ
jgi:hypothetical protein